MNCTRQSCKEEPRGTRSDFLTLRLFILFLCGWCGLAPAHAALHSGVPNTPAKSGDFRGVCRDPYHNPETGRFWTQDSFEGFGNDPSSLHKYTYCHNNPVNAFDPSGHVTLTEVGQAMYAQYITLTITYPSISFAVHASIALINLAMFTLDEQYRMDFIASLGPNLALSVLADSSLFLFNSGANFARGTFNVVTRASQLGYSIRFRDPGSIKYLQNSISSEFQNGRGTVQEMIDGLKAGSIKPNQVEPIRVFRTSDGDLFTLDHRRLYAFRQAGDLIPTVEVSSQAVADEIMRKATGDGANIFIRP